jgi:hypothetical protein
MKDGEFIIDDFFEDLKKIVKVINELKTED